MHDVIKSGLLRCKDKEIVDKNNQPFLLRGLGIGGWLVMEGYMLHTKAASPTTIKNAVFDLIGKKDGEEFIKRYTENYFNENDIKAIASFNLNSIRLPFHYNLLSTKRGEYHEEGFALIDQVIKWCYQYNLYLILDMHCAPGSQNGQNISDGDIDYEAKLFTKKEIYQPWTIEIWEEIARRYKDEDIIAGYDLINEPVLPQSVTMDDLRAFYIDLTKAIRLIDKRHIIFIEGNMYATDFSKLSPKWDDNMAYSFHKYWNPTTVESIKERALDLREQTNAPLWMGESGENTNQWFYDTIKLLEDHNIGWNWWTHKKVDNLTNPFSAKIGKKYRKVVDYFHNLGPRPTKKEAKKGLFELCESLRLENCDYLKDVVAAICDLSGLEKSTPYSTNLIPNKIYAANYDIGANNIAYKVKLAKRENMGIRNNFNNGRKYRNDAISIFTSKDKLGNGYDVGLFEDESWVKYSLFTLKDEMLNVSIRYKGEGMIKLIVNEQEKIVKLSSTNYKSKTIGYFTFKNGLNEVYLYTLRNGIFVSYLEMIK